MQHDGRDISNLPAFPAAGENVGVLLPNSIPTICTVLGLSAFYHDSAAALIHDGVVVAAGEEERRQRPAGKVIPPAISRSPGSPMNRPKNKVVAD